MDRKTLVVQELAGVKAGSTGVVITLADDVLETVSGVVVSLGGSPVASVKVNPQRDVMHLDLEGGSSSQDVDIPGAVTDDQGRFTLRRVPAKGVYLWLDGANILPRDFGRDGGLLEAAKGQELGKLRIEVSVRCHLQVDLSAQPGLADELAIQDAAGNDLPIDVFLGNGRMTADRTAISEGRTGVLAVPENTTTVILYKQGAQVARKAVRPVPGIITTVTP